MKKIASACLTLVLALSLAACGGTDAPSSSQAALPLEESQPVASSSQALADESSAPAVPSQSDSEANAPSAVPESDEKQIKITVDGQEYAAALYDTPAANSLYEMLPLEVTFEDYNSVEKIAYLPENGALTTKGEPAGFDPAAGDLCLYAPWGNLSVFYQDFHYSEGLVSLGHLSDAAIETIGGMTDNFSMLIEKSG